MERVVLEHLRMRLPPLALILLAPAAALAEPNATVTKSAQAPTYELGLRIGGYGFHREGDSRPGEGWSECRMNLRPRGAQLENTVVAGPRKDR